MWALTAEPGAAPVATHAENSVSFFRPTLSSGRPECFLSRSFFTAVHANVVESQQCVGILSATGTDMPKFHQHLVPQISQVDRDTSFGGIRVTPVTRPLDQLRVLLVILCRPETLQVSFGASHAAARRIPRGRTAHGARLSYDRLHFQAVHAVPVVFPSTSASTLLARHRITEVKNGVAVALLPAERWYQQRRRL